jgi:hypothetical protein
VGVGFATHSLMEEGWVKYRWWKDLLRHKLKMQWLKILAWTTEIGSYSVNDNVKLEIKLSLYLKRYLSDIHIVELAVKDTFKTSSNILTFPF